MSNIREFYANVLEVGDDIIMVKAILVSFGKLSSNPYYGLRDIQHGEYEAYLEDIDYDEVIQTMIVGEAEWKIQEF